MTKSLILSLSLLVVGLFLSVDGANRCGLEPRSEGVNFLELKRSPYGEVVAMALQDPVNLIWHSGTGHEHYLSQEIGPLFQSDKHWLKVLKMKLFKYEVQIRQNNSPVRNRYWVREYEKKQVEGLVRIAYSMDPTNYAIYNALNYAIVTGGDLEYVAARQLALETMKYSVVDKRDPYDALTAASAAENRMIYLSLITPREQFGKLRGDFEYFKSLAEHFRTLLPLVYSNDQLSDARKREFSNRADMFDYNVEKMDQVIAEHE